MLTTGTIVGGKYRLEEPIGQGGMATVWRAVHTTLDRSVAVKFLEAVGTQSQQLAGRFLQEAKLAAGLRHRHVVDIVDFGVIDGQPFMVMEYLEGKSLADRYAEGPPISDIELIEIVCMTLSGLAAVHDAGILHRDVKPENIFLVEDADGQYPKLLDFGVSRGLGGGGRFTRTGAVVGTPQYMSPEQARGKRDLDHRSDLYAVGTILYEGFTGDVPFDSENPGDVLIMVATEEPVPLEDLRPDLPEGVVEVVHRALHKRPDERFQDAREMRNALLAELEWGDTSGVGRMPGERPGFSSSGTGLIRVISKPTSEQPPSSKHEGRREAITGDDTMEIVEVQRVAPAKKPPRPVRAQPPPPPPKLPSPTPRDAPAQQGELQTAMLPPVPPAGPVVSAPSKGRSSDRMWLAASAALVILVAAGVAVWKLDVLTTLGLIPPDASGAIGEVRPGEAVPRVVSDPPPPEDPSVIDYAPPPRAAEGPQAETIDVPSPPDPPEAAPADELSGDDDT